MKPGAFLALIVAAGLKSQIFTEKTTKTNGAAFSAMRHGWKKIHTPGGVECVKSGTWLYVPGQGALNEELPESSRDSVPLLFVRGKHTSPRSLRQRWKQGKWIRHLSGMTLDPSTASRGVESFIQFLRDSPANPSAQPDSKKEQKTLGTFGRTLPESLGRFDQGSCSWRTWQQSLISPLPLSVQTWPKWGMIRRGVLFALPIPALPTVEDAGSVWPSVEMMPTPTTQINQHSPSTIARGGRIIFPTPTVIHAKRGNHDEDPGAFLDRQEAYRKKTGGSIGMSLGVAVKLWSTPIAREAQDTHLDLKKTRSNGKKRNDSLTRQVSLDEGLIRGGRLNPEWVEWLMGWPIGWTDCEPLETE